MGKIRSWWAGLFCRQLSEREILLWILKELHHMAVDLSNLNAAIAKLSSDADLLIASHGAADPAIQQAIDAATADVAAVSAKVEAAVAAAAV